MCNTQFRRDYWVKGARQLGTFERGDLLRSQRVMLTNSPQSIELKVNGPRGEATLNENVYKAILDLLVNYQAMTLGQIEDAVKDQGLVFSQVLQASMILISKGDLALVQDDTVIANAKRVTDKLNLHLMKKCMSSDEFSYLASPVTGGAISVNRFQQLFLLARSLGQKDPEEWAQFVWQRLDALNQRLTKAGKMIESRDENLAELNRQATEFAETRLPVLKALQIA